MSIPSRASDAGSEGRPNCPRCGSRKWHTLTSCSNCATVICDRCPRSHDGPGNELTCHPCWEQARERAWEEM